MALDGRKFRDAIGHFASGVAIIATGEADGIHAMTANAVSSVSLDPMLVLFCPSKKAKLVQQVDSLKSFTINFLSEEQQDLSTYFAGAWKDSVVPEFQFVHFAGAPRLEGALVSLVCSTESLVEGGDHWIVIGRVTDAHFGVGPLKPLLFFRGKYRTVDFRGGNPAPPLDQVANEPAHIYYEM